MGDPGNKIPRARNDSHITHRLRSEEEWGDMSWMYVTREFTEQSSGLLNSYVLIARVFMLVTS